jgi:hypothetical protein
MRNNGVQAPRNGRYTRLQLQYLPLTNHNTLSTHASHIDYPQ